MRRKEKSKNKCLEWKQHCPCWGIRKGTEWHVEISIYNFYPYILLFLQGDQLGHTCFVPSPILTTTLWGMAGPFNTLKARVNRFICLIVPTQHIIYTAELLCELFLPVHCFASSFLMWTQISFKELCICARKVLTTVAIQTPWGRVLVQLSAGFVKSESYVHSWIY